MACRRSWRPRPRSLVGAVLGAINGAIVVRFRIHSFVVTLGTMLIWRGVLIALTGGFPMTVPVPPEFKNIMAGPLLAGFRMSMLWFFVIGALGHVPAVADPVRATGSRRAGRTSRRRATSACPSIASR